MKREKAFRPDRIGSYFRVEWLPLALVTLSGLIYNIGLLATPWFEGRLAQCLAHILGGNATAGKMAVLVLAYILVTLGVQAARFIKRFYVRRFANNINRRMKGILYANLVRRSRASLEQEGAGELMTKAISDVDDCVEGMRKFTTEVFDTGMDEGELSYPPSFNARIWLADLDADACPEIYFCGDMSSDDYVLNAWSCKSGTPELIPFEDQLFLEASILSISEGSLQLESTQDVLGSYEAVRAYVLRDGVLVPLGDAWQIVPANTSYSRLSLVRDLPVTLDDGTESTFGPGTILQVTGTDGKSFVDVITEDGVTGRIAITQPAGDWQWYINGEPELEYFELVPYAG